MSPAIDKQLSVPSFTLEERITESGMRSPHIYFCGGGGPTAGARFLAPIEIHEVHFQKCRI